MPYDEIKKRGGASRIRTKKIGKNKYARVYVTPEEGPKGGHTVMGEVKTKGKNTKDTHMMPGGEEMHGKMHPEERVRRTPAKSRR